MTGSYAGLTKLLERTDKEDRTASTAPTAPPTGGPCSRNERCAVDLAPLLTLLLMALFLAVQPWSVLAGILLVTADSGLKKEISYVGGWVTALLAVAVITVLNPEAELRPAPPITTTTLAAAPAGAR